MSASRGRILIVDDDIEVREMLTARLRAEGFEAVAASDGAEGLRRIRQEDFDLVLLDLQMPEMDGMAVLRRLQEERLDATVVVMTAYGSVERAVEAMKAGAFDFIPKPLSAERLRVVVEKAAERQQLRRENAYFREEAADALPTPIGDSPKMQEVLKVARRAAQSTATVLLLGESGTGKEVLARAIHGWSPRRERPFVAVNCVALSEHLLESELFGHEKGAFTGAHGQRKGRFEVARGGTILLDEVGAMKPDLQVKLLRVLQEGEFERVGGSQAIQTDVRVIAATNRDLERAMAEGSFLKDLYFRLNVVSVSLPPLRERREDIPALARFFLQKYAHEAKRGVTGISEEAMACLSAYSWPGNVRELENAVERAVVLGAGEEVGPEDLPDQVVGMGQPQGPDGAPGAGFHESVQAYKRQLIRGTLEKTGGNQSRAAEALGLQRTYLARLIRTLEVK
ncbi:sigma-54-dependent Fis family transcriptional regulator [bacterium]|nr:sigma-54-dependent Fis family transcriptional regulator [bacterium]